ncbi:MAG: hypothetical protein FJ288_12575 [Planctomycetes bacterium]|nr:hypothetical protein [Planctomycetota bacterium]
MQAWEQVRLQPLIPLAWAAAATSLAAAIVVAAAMVRPPAVSRGRRAALLVLRLAAVVAAGLMLLAPLVRRQAVEERPGAVILLLDASRSMAVADALDPQDARPEKAALGAPIPVSRAEAVRQAMAAARKPYADLAARFAMRPYAFGSRVRPGDALVPEPQDPWTDLGEALDLIVRQIVGQPDGEGEEAVAGARPAPAAVVLISDGRANRARGSPEAAARLLAARGIRVHAVLAGSAEPTDRVRDVSVRDVRAPARAAAGGRAEVRAVVSAFGFAGRSFEAVLSLDGKEVERRRLAPGSHRFREGIIFTPRLGGPGLARLAVAIEPQPGELAPANNRAEAVVRVEEGDLRVLYLDGRIAPEGKFLSRLLGDMKEATLDRRLLLGVSGRGPHVGGAAAGADVVSLDDIDACRILVLGDLPASAIPAAAAARIAGRIRDGSLSLLALGGLSAYGAGGWAETPVAGVLPFAIAASDGQAPGPITLRPAAGAAGHFIFSADGGAGPEFRALPTLAGANAVGGLHVGARLLAQAADGGPLMAVRQVGRGRVAAVTVDSTWQWALASDETRGPETYRRLWRRTILWLAGRDRPAETELTVAADRPRYVVADADRPPVAEVTAQAPPGAAGLRLELAGPDGSAQAVTLEAAGGQWRAAVPLSCGGTYTLRADADLAGVRQRAEAAFVVEQPDYESADLLADAEAMGRIARAGGGTLRRIDELPTLLAELAATLEPRAATVERWLPLTSGGVFLAAVLALLAAEWVLRRRWTGV